MFKSFVFAIADPKSGIALGTCLQPVSSLG